MKKRKKQVGLNAVFCRRLLMLIGKNDMPSAGTLGAVMYRLTQSGVTKNPKITALTLIQYLTKPEYRHNLSPRILAILASLEGPRPDRASPPSTLLAPKIYKQLWLLRNLGLIKYMPSRGCESLTPLGRRLFKNWPYLRAAAATKEYAFKRAAAAESATTYYIEQAKKAEQAQRKAELAALELHRQVMTLQTILKEKDKPAPLAIGRAT